MPFALKADGYTRNDDPPSVQAGREALVNLLMHMDYFDAKGAVVKCYDDQILFRNAGCLRFPIERIEQHLTEPRNPVIAKVFRLLGWADRSGSGIEKITKGWTSMGYDKPIFQDDKPVNMFEVIFPLVKESEKKTKSSVKGSVRSSVKSSVKSSVRIIELIREDKNITIPVISEKLGLTTRAIEKQMVKLQESGLIRRVGPDKGGHWEVLKEK